MGHCLLKIDIVIASGRCCVYRKKHSVSYRGLTMVSKKQLKILIMLVFLTEFPLSRE
ncbi:hypothetical protein [Rickettsia endosymbiont of Ixodes pacificus]|uniref:hypothetical protein n=1 Tax=Rickettsia endosymbiont of Ixodes pacificus TaxID=1133329 RepID=UPI00397E2557